MKFISNEFQIFVLLKLLNKKMCINENIEEQLKKHSYLFILFIWYICEYGGCEAGYKGDNRQEAKVKQFDSY